MNVLMQLVAVVIVHYKQRHFKSSFIKSISHTNISILQKIKYEKKLTIVNFLEDA